MAHVRGHNSRLFIVNALIQVIAFHRNVFEVWLEYRPDLVVAGNG